MNQGPLAGVRVIDLSMWWAGPFLTKVLGDLGAEVLKIESVQVLDGWRGATTGQAEPANPSKPWERSFSFNGANRNKYGLTLNLKHPDGNAILKRLVSEGDILVENYTPRVMENFGLSYDILSEIRPELIMVSLSGYGHAGPWRNYQGFASPIEDMSGFPRITGFAEQDRPSRWGNANTDSLAGLNGAIAVLAALEQRRRTGRGQHIDVSMVEVLTSFLAQPIIESQVTGVLPARMGNRHPAHAPHGIYPCAEPETWVAIAVTSDAQWQALCEVMQRSDWLSDASLTNAEGRKSQEDSLDADVRAWTSAMDRFQVMRACQAAGVPAMPVLSSPDLLHNEHMESRGYYQWTERTEIGRHAHGMLWAHFHETPITLRMPAPTLGEHNKSVLQRILHLDDEELGRLENEGVIGSVPSYWYGRQES